MNSWAELNKAGPTGVSLRLLGTMNACKAVSPEFALKEEDRPGWNSNRGRPLFYNFATG